MPLSLHLPGRRRVLPVLQSEAAECGLACLAMLATYHGRRTDLARLRQQCSLSLKGMTLAQLMQCARTLQFAPRPLRLALRELGQLSTPCILHWNLEHFVVLERVQRDGAVIVDPALGKRRVSQSELGKSFSGIAVELTPVPSFTRGRQVSRLRIGEIARGSHGLWRALALVLVLSLLLQALALLLPFYSQLIFDKVVRSSDRDLLYLLAAAFGLLAVVQAVLSVCRAWVVLAAGTRLNLQWTMRVFRHLLRLPLDYFEKRHLGDLQSRFGSVAALQQLVTGHFVEAAIDGLMTLTTLAVLFHYEPRLAAVVAASAILYVALRLLFYPAQLQAARAAIAAGARRDSCFLESMRGVLAIKSFSAEAQRELEFQERLVESWNTTVQSAGLTVWQDGTRQLLFGLQFVVVMWLGADAIIAAELTPGMLVAIVAYRSLFTERAAAFIDRVADFRLARLQLDRLADIVQTAPEPAFARPRQPPRRSPRLALSAHDLAYRYADLDAPVLEGINLAIDPGEHVVVTGASGCGKTTLLKLLMGLLQATGGSVRIDGLALQDFGLRNFRRHCACVMQNDRLFKGTLLDNICFFDRQPDLRLARRCAEIADIAADIDAMPMQFLSLAGDMGAALSGGQVQRVLLARALYRQPRLLFLDEFTSQLDGASEARIHARLRALDVTVVAVAHRRETVLQAQREIHLGLAAKGT